MCIKEIISFLCLFHIVTAVGDQKIISVHTKQNDVPLCYLGFLNLPIYFSRRELTLYLRVA